MQVWNIWYIIMLKMGGPNKIIYKEKQFNLHEQHDLVLLDAQRSTNKQLRLSPKKVGINYMNPHYSI